MTSISRSVILAAGLLAFPLAGAGAQAIDTGKTTAPGVAPGAATDGGRTGAGPRGTPVAPSTSRRPRRRLHPGRQEYQKGPRPADTNEYFGGEVSATNNSGDAEGAIVGAARFASVVMNQHRSCRP